MNASKILRKLTTLLILASLSCAYSCTLALSETEIKDTKGNIQEGTSEVQKPSTDIAPSLTVPVSPK